jgi:hypothetical protein
VGHQLKQFGLTEEEGGAPEYSSYDIGMSQIGTWPKNQILPFTPGGSQKGSRIFQNRFGLAAEGPGSVQSIPIPDYHYFGGYPLNLQPMPDKPQPWER